ncbi:hypothetical protein EV181_001405 [Coemansia sp. RSA 532]|nr:hypothetical protein EV181_001405 [Coemansia sp. RSA 532]
MEQFMAYCELSFTVAMGMSHARKLLQKLLLHGSMLDYIMAETDICGALDFPEEEHIDMFIGGLENPLRDIMWKHEFTSFIMLINAVTKEDGIACLGNALARHADDIAQRPLAKIVIKGQTVQALLDSGASKSFIAPGFVKSCTYRPRFVRRCACVQLMAKSK